MLNKSVNTDSDDIYCQSCDRQAQDVYFTSDENAWRHVAGRRWRLWMARAGARKKW